MKPRGLLVLIFFIMVIIIYDRGAGDLFSRCHPRKFMTTSITKIPNERRSITLRVISMCLLVQAAWRLLQYAGLVYHLEFHRQQP